MAFIENQMKPEVLSTISRGQKKRLGKKVNAFASKQALEERGRKVRDEMAQQSKAAQREAAKNQAAQKQLNEGFMDLDGGGHLGSSSPSKPALEKFDPMGQALN